MTRGPLYACRACRWLPWLSLAGGILAALAFAAAIPGYALFEDGRLGDVLVEFVSPLTVLGVSAGLANLVTFKRHRIVSLIGLLLGLAVIVVVLFLAFA